MSMSARAVARETLLWLLTALGAASACLGLWVVWLSGQILPLAIGLCMLALIILTRRWSRPGRMPGRHDHLARFALALVVATPAILVVCLALSPIVMIFDREDGSGAVLTLAVAMVCTAAVLVAKRNGNGEKP